MGCEGVHILPVAAVTAKVIEVVVAVFAIWLFLHARDQGSRWVATLLSGMLFGFAAEVIIVKFQQGGVWYEYCGSPFLLRLLDVPIVIGIGWGSILYATTWTAQRLSIPWWLRPFAASLLAINIDLSLDPVASKMHFWTWFTEVEDAATGGMKTVRLDTLADYANYYGVPYDNFLGWFLIVACYALSVRSLFSLYDSMRRDGAPPTPESGTWHTDGKGRYGKKSDAADWIIPLLGASISIAFMALLKSHAVPSLYNSVSSATLFTCSLPIVVWLSWFYASRSNRLHKPTAWPIILLPVFYHSFALASLLGLMFAGHEQFNTLIVAVSFHAIAGFLAFAWPSLAVLFPTNPAAVRARGSSSAAARPQRPAKQPLTVNAVQSDQGRELSACPRRTTGPQD